MLQGLLALLQRDPLYQDLYQQLSRLHQVAASNTHLPALSVGLLEAARPYLIAALQADWPGPVVVLSASPESSRQLAEQVRLWSETAEQVLYFHAPDTIFYDRAPWDRETIHARVSVLATLAAMRSASPPTSPDPLGEQRGGTGLVITTSVWALMTKTAPPLALRRALRTLRSGEELPPYQLLEHLVRSGYQPVSVVEEPGTFGHRGSLIDIYPPNLPEPLRLDFWGDNLDTLRTFDPTTQRSQTQLTEIVLAPASEALADWGKLAGQSLRTLDLNHCSHAAQQRLHEERARVTAGEYFSGMEYYLSYLYPRPATLLDYLPDNALVLIEDFSEVQSGVLNLENQALALRAEMVAEGQLPANWAMPYLAWEELQNRLRAGRAVNLGHGLGEVVPFFGEGGFTAAPRYAGQLQHALDDLAELRRKEQRVVLVTRQAERLADLLREEDVYATPRSTLSQAPEPGNLCIVEGILAEGWAWGPAQLVVLTDAELFGWARVKKRRSTAPRRGTSPESFFADLQPGDYVVHLEHGIGRYYGLVRKVIGNLEREYLEIEYANNDRLYVPVHQAHLVSRYVGADERVPYIHRLGGNEWNVVRSKAQKAARDIAAELLELYALREISTGYAFPTDTPWQHEMEASFPYEETDDQLRALSEVKTDMEQPKPMDRLLCGDVGYGKTEVALRAAFKAVIEGRQVAVLVPTTVLAQQHFYTFRRRLRAFPVAVEMLSRFRTPQEQDEVIQGLLTGQVDIVIGTHRLLSKDVVFKDLGLLIIDEEQRFGVSHKEQLKQLRHEVDVLTLTATPIPRTLYMALSGARDMSVIDTPPEDRLPVRTYVSEYDEALIRKAILRETDRGGQVYFVHNRVQDIYQVAEELQRLLPEVTLVVGHGQMDEDELAQVMLGFAQGEHDVLVCTTIIESGLDIPNVNTIIINNADNFGLAQLYQLRGRVGRGVNRAYAYLLYKGKLTDIAHKRLETILEASELGAGFRVAMRDMEIRGAGEILGGEQHGHIAAIGFDLYCRLLQQAVQELRAAAGSPLDAIHKAQHQVAAEASATAGGPTLDLPLSAYLPEDYMSDGALRLRFYRRMARVENETELAELTQELVDRFGALPATVQDLMYLLQVRVLASAAGILAINVEEDELALTLPLAQSPARAAQLATRWPGVRARGTRIWLKADAHWRETLLRLLRHLGTLRPMPVPA